MRTQSLQKAALQLSHRCQFRGKRHVAGLFGLNDEDVIPEGVEWVDCVDGIRFTAATPRDIMLRTLYIDGHYQDDVLVALGELLQPGQVFWDIGANYGFMSLWVDKHFRGEVRTFAFEPSPVVLPFLEKNIAENRSTHITVERTCLSDRSGEVEFFFSKENSWNATLMSDFAEQHGETLTIQVPTVRMDDAVESIPPPDVIKLDVEGAEHLVIAGGSEFLARHRPPIVAEYNVRGFDSAGLDGPGYLKLFTDLGYEPHVMPRPLVGWHRWKSLRKVESANDLGPLCNLVMLPKP